MTAPKQTVLALALLWSLSACDGSGQDDATDSTSPSATTVARTTPASTSTAPPTSTDPSTTNPSRTKPPPQSTATSLTTTTIAEPVRAPSIRSIIDDGTFLELAHAGGDQDAPHSTRFAFEEAVRAGATALELDVQLTADGVLIVQHDDTVDKTTEATGPVNDLTLDEIQALDNAYWFSPLCWPCQDRPAAEYVYRGIRSGDSPPPPGYTADDFRVPTFTEIATAFPELPLDIEIKGTLPDAASVAEKLALELRLLNREESVVVVSFDDQVVDVFRGYAPNVAVSPGLGRLTAWFLEGAELEPYFEVLQLPPFQGEIQVVDADIVERIHDEGRVVWVWPDDAASQENAEFYELLIGYGVDGVIAGRPSALTATAPN